MDRKEDRNDLQDPVADGHILLQHMRDQDDNGDLRRQKQDHKHDPQRRRNAALTLLPYLHSFHLPLFLPVGPVSFPVPLGAGMPHQFFSFRRRVLMS